MKYTIFIKHYERGKTMRITDLLKPTAIELNANVSSKIEEIDKLIALNEAAGNLTD